jgi:competence protein ComEC
VNDVLINPAADRWTWVDLRLVPVALALWVGTLVGPRLTPGLLLAAALLPAGVVAVLVRRPRRWSALAAGALVGLALAGVTGAVRGFAREASPLRAAADEGRTVAVELELAGDPRRLSGAGLGRVVADATVTVVAAGDRRHRVDDAVLLFAPAEAWADVLPGQPVQARVRVAPPQAGQPLVAVLSARGPPTLLGPPGAVQELAGTVRDGLAAAAARVLDPRPAGLVPGLAVGDTRAMDPVLTEEFRRAGLTHLTAVSGANVAIVVACVLWPLRRRAVDRRVQAMVAGIALVAFVVLARPSPSVVRAAAMGAVALLALASGRSRAAVPALAAAVVVLLLLDPVLAVDPGFALSVAATAAIVLLAPGWSRRLRARGCRPLVADALAVSAAAGSATAPLIAGIDGTVSLVSLPANLLAAPAVAPVTVLGLAAAVVAPVVPPVADALVWLAGWPARWLDTVAATAAGLPDGAVAWPAGTGGAVLLTCLLLLLGGLLWRFRRLRPFALAALVGLVAVGWPVRQAVRGWPPPDTLAVICDVGQGDAIVLPTGEGSGVLVDAGPDVGAVDRCLERLGVTSLPLVLVSHLDADHVGGLAGALAGRDIGAVATGTLSSADERAPAFAAQVERAGADRLTLVPGDRRSVGSVTLEVLAPDPAIATGSAAANDLSLVVRAEAHGLSILLTGDLGAGAESALRRGGTDLRADVLKVPHHGSGDADPEFLAATGARVALVSVGADNTYGHPAPRLLDWLARAGMRVHRTDREGDLALAGDANSWGVAVAEPVTPQAAADGPAPPTGAPAPRRERRTAVTPCRSASPSRGADVPPAGGDRRGGAPAVARGVRGALRRARPPPGGRDQRPRGGRPARRRAGRGARPVAVRRAPPGGGPGRARVRGGAGRFPGRLREGPGSRPDARRRPLRRQAQRGPGQGVQGGGRRSRRVPQGLLGRRPHRVRPQRGPPGRWADHPRRGHRAGRRGRG